MTRTLGWMPAVVLAVSLAGCGGGGNVDRADPSLPRVTVEVTGMT